MRRLTSIRRATRAPPDYPSLHQPQAGAVEQPGHEQVHTGEVGKNAVDLISGQDSRQAFRFLGAQGVNGTQVLVQHLAVEEEQRAEGLVLGRGGNIFFHRQVGEKGLDFRRAHFGRVAHIFDLFRILFYTGFQPPHRSCNAQNRPITMKLQKIILLFVTVGMVLAIVACNTTDLDSTYLSATLDGIQDSPSSAPSPTRATDPTQTPTIIDPDRRPDFSITSSAVTPDEALWYAFDVFDDIGGSPFHSQNHGLYRLKDGQVTHFDIPGAVRVLTVAPDGSLYVGAGWGVLRYHADNWETLLNVDGSHPSPVSGLAPLSIAFADSGDAWVGGALKLARFDGEEWKEYDIPAARVAIASDDTVWTVGWDGRADSDCCITHIAGSEWMTYTWTSNVPAEPEVLQLLFD